MINAAGGGGWRILRTEAGVCEAQAPGPGSRPAPSRARCRLRHSFRPAGLLRTPRTPGKASLRTAASRGLVPTPDVGLAGGAWLQEALGVRVLGVAFSEPTEGS